MNEYDSDQLSQFLLKSDLYKTDDPEKADIILINTCSVRAKAEQKAYSLLGRMISLKKRRPNLVLGLMGCVAQQEGKGLFKRFPSLDMVIGTREINNIPEILNSIERYGEKISSVDLNIVPTPINCQN
ncbi:tRNA (N6-isopentenyl adenosine(37)-C2)-methylthiotransferase MiaB, partial [Thermodesulfobacteriota bacterium]